MAGIGVLIPKEWWRSISAEGAGRWGLAVSLLGAALALGSIHTPVLVTVAVVAVASTALLWWNGKAFTPRPAATMLLCLALALLGYTALQVVPLPRGILAALSPHTADVWSRALTPFHQDGPSFASMSLDPNATRVQLLRGVTYVAVYVGALLVAQRRDGITFLERSLIVASVVVAAAAAMHPVLGSRKVLGVYEPKEMIAYDPHHIGPFLDTNHLAAFANIGLLVAFGAVVSRRDTLPRLLAVVVVILLGATTVWTLSRGGTGAMLVGVVVVAVMAAFGARHVRVAQKLGPAAVVAIGLGGVALGYLSLFDETRAKFAHNDLMKIGLARNALGLLNEYGTFGVGRGAFASTFPKIREGGEYVVFTHPENIIAQWTTEWGLPVSIAAVAALLYALRPKTALARSRPAAGAWGALFAVGAQNLVDFSSEIPGVMIALAICAAIVTGGTDARLAKTGRRWLIRPRVTVSLLAAATFLAILATLPFVEHELYVEERRMRDLALDRDVTNSVFEARLREAMLGHPAEAYFPFVGMVRAASRGEDVVPWAARALDRSPTYGRVHLLLARSFYARNRAQARLEYRLACEQDSQVCQVEECLPLVRGYDDAIELVPSGARRAAILARLTTALAPRLPSTVVRLDRELRESDPTTTLPVVHAVAAILSDVRNEEAWCADHLRSGCLDEALDAVREIEARSPTSCEGYALEAQARVAKREVDAAFAQLEIAADRVEDRAACNRELLALARSVGPRARIDAALDRLLKGGCSSSSECVENLVFAANVELDRGGARRGIALLWKAWERAPERDDLLVTIATRGPAEHAHGDALEAYTKLAASHPDDPAWREGASRERAIIARDAVMPRLP